jgi:hypothetical protein
MAGKTKPLREIAFAEIQDRFLIDVHGPGPGVGRRTEGGYYIRITKSIETNGISETRKFDYFRLAEDGEVTTAPRGHAKDYRPARIVGMPEAVLLYAMGDVLRSYSSRERAHALQSLAEGAS